MALTATKIKALQPRTKPYKAFDEKGLYLLVNPTGSKLWRFKYRYNGRENHLAFGKFPDTSLARARDKRDDARKLIADEIDPAAKRREEKRAQGNTFGAIAGEWLDAGCPGGRKKKVAPETASQIRRRLENYVFPTFGRWSLEEITVSELLKLLRRIESSGHHETAHRVRAVCSRVFRYAITTGRADRDPAVELLGTLAPVETQHFAAITEPKKVGGLLRAIEGYEGHGGTRAALKMLALTFVRPGELRLAKWSEFDLDDQLWRIPSTRMKMEREHLVPLSDQTIAILEEIKTVTLGDYVFESVRKKRPLSDNAFNAALRTMGYAGDVMTAHGFRSTASTLLHELGWPPEVIESQLAHKRAGVAGIYDRSARLDERKEMMQVWADYLDALREGGSVVPIRKREN